jgi:hypothetical protein
VICDTLLAVAVLSILWLASLGALALLVLLQTSASHSCKTAIGIADIAFWLILSESSNYRIAFVCLSISINILATTLLAVKLIRQQRRMSAACILLSGSRSNSIYTSVSTVFIESAALYTIFGIIYLPFQAITSPLEDPFSLLFRMMSFIGPALIQLRLAQNSAYSRSATELKTPIVFIPQSQIERTTSGPMATIPDLQTTSADESKAKSDAGIA